MSNVCLDIQSMVDIKKTMFSQAMCLKVSRVKEYFCVVLKLPYLKKELCSWRENGKRECVLISMGRTPATQKEHMHIKNSWIWPETHKEYVYYIVPVPELLLFFSNAQWQFWFFLDNHSNHENSSLRRLSTSKIRYTSAKSCCIQTNSYLGRIPASRRLSQEHSTCTNAVGISERNY